MKITEDIVDKAITAQLKWSYPITKFHRASMRNALEAVWPEPRFTPEEIGALKKRLWPPVASDEAECSAWRKLEAMANGS